MNNYEYFLFFLKHKIDSGYKQVAIAKSVDLSTAYINKLYKNPPKSCLVETQEKIVEFFGLTYEEMIEKSKELLQEQPLHQKPSGQHGKSRSTNQTSTTKYPSGHIEDPSYLQEQLFQVSSSIQQNYNYLEEVVKERDNLLALLNLTKTCICIIEDDLSISFQNEEHKRIFGNKKDQKYTLFWQEDINDNELREKLVYENIESKLIKHNDKAYLAQVVVNKNIDKITKIFEQIICLSDIDRRFSPRAAAEDQEIGIYHKIFKQLDHGFGFFNPSRVLEIASNKFDLIDPKYNYPDIKPSVDQILLDLSERIHGDVKTITKLKNAYENREEIDVNVQIDNNRYNIQTLTFTENGIYEGTLVIVRPINT